MFVVLTDHFMGLNKPHVSGTHNLQLAYKSLQFVQSQADNCLFVYNSSRVFLVLLVYVDGVLIPRTSLDLIQEIKQSLHGAFTIKDLSAAKCFFGLEIARSSSGICVTQQKYLSDLIKDAGLVDAKPVTTPLPAGLHLT